MLNSSSQPKYVVNMCKMSNIKDHSSQLRWIRNVLIWFWKIGPTHFWKIGFGNWLEMSLSCSPTHFWKIGLVNWLEMSLSSSPTHFWNIGFGNWLEMSSRCIATGSFCPEAGNTLRFAPRHWRHIAGRRHAPLSWPTVYGTHVLNIKPKKLFLAIDQAMW